MPEYVVCTVCKRDMTTYVIDFSVLQKDPSMIKLAVCPLKTEMLLPAARRWFLVRVRCVFLSSHDIVHGLKVDPFVQRYAMNHIRHKKKLLMHAHGLEVLENNSCGRRRRRRSNGLMYTEIATAKMKIQGL